MAFEIVRFSELAKDNTRLREFLGLGPGTLGSLSVKAGFFVCPDDKETRGITDVPVLRLRMTIIDILQDKFPDIYNEVRLFYRRVGDRGSWIDREDYSKFKDGMKLAFFFAATGYVDAHGLSEIRSLDELYSGKGSHAKEIQAALQRYLSLFLTHADSMGVKRNLFSLFDFAVGYLRRFAPRMVLPSDMRMTAFIAGSEYAPPFIKCVGEAFEDEVEHAFELFEQVHLHEILQLLRPKLGPDIMLITFDVGEGHNAVSMNAKRGRAVPDYVACTKQALYPVELKLRPKFKNLIQISGGNLSSLIWGSPYLVNRFFAGILVDGKFVGK